MKSSSRPEVLAIYCPLWHSYDHMSAWKGEGWCEWELLKAAKPRFKGHYQPYKPTWGHFDESDPKWSRREIALAADHGIDVFLVDWYWYSGVPIMEEALERGLLKAPNRNRIKFALMWANHHWYDYFPAAFGQDTWNSWLPIRHSPADWLRVMDYCIENYFSKPNYWQPDGKLFFSLFKAMPVIEAAGGVKGFKSLLAQTNRRLAKLKLPPLHLNAMEGDTRLIPTLQEAGFETTTLYGVTGGEKAVNLVEDYDTVIEAHQNAWAKMAATELPHIPVAMMGWDVTPRCVTSVKWPFPPSKGPFGTYPYTHVVVGNTPAKFQKLLEMAREHAEKHPTPLNAVLINAWNEWTEGSFLLPERRYGNGYLEAIARAFGRKSR